MTPGAPQGGFPSFSSREKPEQTVLRWVDTQGLSHATQAYLLGPGSSTAQLWVSLCKQAPQTLLPIDQKQSPKQMYANYRLQGRVTHLLNRSSPQTSPTTLPTPQPPTPGVASRRKELKFHFEEAVPLAKIQHPLPYLPLQHTGPGERSGFSGKGGEGWGVTKETPRPCLFFGSKSRQTRPNSSSIRGSLGRLVAQ